MTSTGSDYNEWLDELDDDVRQLNYIDPGHIPDLIARARLAGEYQEECMCPNSDCYRCKRFHQLEAERKGEGDG